MIVALFAFGVIINPSPGKSSPGISVIYEYDKLTSLSFDRILKRHEESVHCVSFSSDSNILLSACMIGNIRVSYMNNENEGTPNKIYLCY